MSRPIQFQKTVFGKTILLFAVIISIIGAIQLYAFNWSNRSLISKSLSGAASQTQSCALFLESSIEHISSMLYGLNQDQDLQKLAYASKIMTQYEKSTSIVRVCKIITGIMNSSELIEDVRILIPPLQITLHPEGNVSGSYSSMDEDELNQLLLTNRKRGMTFANLNGEMLMSLRSPVDQSNQQPGYLIIVQFSEKMIKKLYMSLVSSSNDPFIINIAGNKILSDTVQPVNQTDLYLWTSAQNDPFTTFEMNSDSFFVTRQSSKTSLVEVIQLLSQNDIIEPLRPLRLINIVFFIGSVLMIVIYVLFTNRIIKKPMVKFADAFRQLEIGDFESRLDIDKNDDFAYLYNSYNQMLDKLDQLIYEVYDTKINLQRSELKQLQSQINPHFLFNSYFLLHRIILMNDYEKAVRFSKGMGIYFQYITRNGLDMVTLEQEYEHACIYADIQAARFEERIEIEYQNLPQSLKDFKVPKLIIQPLIENAFEHGLEDKAAEGLLQVSFIENESWVKIAVEDNGCSANQELIERMQNSLEQTSKTEEVTALINIHRRIRGIYGPKSGLVISRSDLCGLKSEIQIEKPRVGGVINLD